MGIREWISNRVIATLPQPHKYNEKIYKDMRKNVAWYIKKHGVKPQIRELSDVYIKNKVFMSGAHSYGITDKDILDFAKEVLEEAQWN